ncbi:MAG: hypothetical protein R3F22_01815 [Lysobacteraceae bacterium]
MDRIWILTNLREAAESLDSLIEAVEAEADPALVDAVVSAQVYSVYRKLNYAWNTRHVASDEAISEAGYDEAVQYPKDFDF